MSTLEPDDVKRARAAFATHEMHEAQSRSFLFQKQTGGSAYHFRLTWTPGMVAISGDLGELQVVHYHALADFESGMYWLKDADAQYLLGKCPGYRKRFDADATLAWIKQHLSEEVIEALNGHDHSWSYNADGSKRPRVGGFRHDLQKWRRDLAKDRAEGLPEEEWAERPDYDDPRAITKKAGFETQCSIDRYKVGNEISLSDYYHIPDCWDRWVRAWRWDNPQWCPRHSTRGPEEVLDREVRAHILDEIQGELHSQDSAISVIQSIGIEGYYGEERYPSQAAYLYEALQLAAREITASFTLAWGDPVC